MLPSNFLLVWPAPCLQHVDVGVPELPMYLIAKKLLISWRLNWTLKFQSLFQIIRIMNWGFNNKGISRVQKAVDAVACSCWYVYLLFLWSGFHLLSLTFFQQEYATIFEQKYGWWLTKAKHSYVLNCESDSQPSSYAANVQKYLSFPKLWPPISSWIRPPISHVLSEKMYWQYVNGRSSGCSLKLTKSHQPICILSNLLRLFSYYQSTISQVGEKNQGYHNKKAELCFRSSDWRSG